MVDIVEVENDDYKDFLSIDIFPGNVCNYSCHYCHPGSNEGDKKFPKDYDLFVKNIDHLLNVYKKNFNKKKIKIELSGGEPSLWRRIGDFARHLKTNHPEIFCLMITTNASRTIRWWKENAKYFDEVHISLHLEGNPNHIIEVADYIYNETDNHVAVNVILDPTQWDRCIDYLDTVVKHPTPWLVKSWLLVSNSVIRSDYTEEQLKEFEDRVKKVPPKEYIEYMLEKGFISNPSSAKAVYADGSKENYVKLNLKRTPGLNNFYGWACNVGVDRLSIMFGDVVASCGARYLFGLEKPLSVYDTDFIEKFDANLVSPTICREPLCGTCTKDLRVPKKKLLNSKKVIPILNAE